MNSVKMIVEMLALDKHLGISENVEIAKGKYMFPKGIKEQWHKANRKLIMDKVLRDGRKESN